MKRLRCNSRSFLWVVAFGSVVSSRAAETAPEKNLEIKGSIQKIKALPVSEIGNGEMVGFSQNLTITSVRTGGDAPLSIEFNQDVGEQMKTALVSVVGGLQVHYGAWPHGYSAQLSFENKYSPKEFGNRTQLATAIAEIEASQERIEKEAAKLRDKKEIREELEQRPWPSDTPNGRGLNRIQKRNL
jgi:hypothetical protein